MKKTLVAAAFAFTLIGCQPGTATTTAPSNQDKEKNIHIRAPGTKVDIEGRGKGGKVDVDVHPKGQNP